MDGQFNRIENQFDRQSNLIVGVIASFSAMFLGTIGFATWD